MGAAEAEAVAEEGDEAEEAHGDDVWASLALPETPLSVHFVVCVLFIFLSLLDIKVLLFDCALAALYLFFF